MAIYDQPGIYHEEVATFNEPIQPVSISTAGFVGVTEWGPVDTPTLVTSFSEYLTLFGGYQEKSDMTYAVKGFFDNGGTRCYILRVSASGVTGAQSTLDLDDSVPATILTVSSKYEGIYGNDIGVKVYPDALHNSDVTDNALAGATILKVSNPANLKAGSVIEISEGATSEYVKVSTVQTSTAGVHTVILDTGLANGYTTSANVQSTEFKIEVYYVDKITPAETFSGLSIESDVSNFVESVINNSSTGSKYISVEKDATNASGLGLNTPVGVDPLAFLTGGVDPHYDVSGATGLAVTDLVGNDTDSTGLYAFGSIDELGILAFIPNTYSTDFSYEHILVHATSVWAESRKTTVAIFGTDPTKTVETTLSDKIAAGFNSKYAALFNNRIQVLETRPNTGSTTRFITPLGHIAGKIAQVDDLPEIGGVWESPAGSKPYGNLVNALGVEDSLSRGKMGQYNLNNINVVRSFPNEGVLIYGSRTLSQTLKDRYINVVRTLIYAQVSVSATLNKFVFRNNNADTWRQIERLLTSFLEEMWKDGGLKGTNPTDAFFVKVGESGGVQTATDTLEGRIIVEVGIAPNRPGEFLIFRWSQIQSEDGTITIL